MVTKTVYKEFISGRPFGLEIEVNEKIDRLTMADAVREVDPSRDVYLSDGWAMTGGAEGIVPLSMWSVKTDRTCANVQGNHGHEVASPKLSTDNDIILCGNVSDSLMNKKCEVNPRCGLHIHVDISDFSRDQVGVLLARWLKIEDIVSQILPPNRRNNAYAKLMRKKFHNLDYNKLWSGADLYMVMEPKRFEVHHNTEKRVALNLIGYATGLRSPNHTRKTVELRLPESTLDRDDVENWIRFFVYFVTECKNKKMPENLQSTSLDETLFLLELASDQEILFLGPKLHNTKIWFLKRILKFTNNIFLFQKTIDTLNKLHEPLEKFVAA